MKKLILFLFIFLFIPFVFADEGEVKVHSFNVYVNGENQNVDWNDDSITVESGSTLELQLRLRNDYNESVSVDVEGILFEIGDDIERDESTDLEEDEKRTIVFEYYIPKDTKESIYDLDVEYVYTVDGGQYVHRRSFEVRVVEFSANTDEILVNLTQTIADEKKDNNDLLSTVVNLSQTVTALSSCKGRLGELEATNNISIDCLSKYENASRDLASCEAKKSDMITSSQLANELEKARSEGKQETNNTIFLIGVAAGVVYLIMKERKKVGGGGEGKPLTGTW